MTSMVAGSYNPQAPDGKRRLGMAGIRRSIAVIPGEPRAAR
ncbi:MAG TPA: hypothetical protein VGU69_02615 [Rhizomicrobium sp.]|nr:hypothetical protein [Rhizomicrobium sp.]